MTPPKPSPKLEPDAARLSLREIARLQHGPCRHDQGPAAAWMCWRCWKALIERATQEAWQAGFDEASRAEKAAKRGGR